MNEMTIIVSLISFVVAALVSGFTAFKMGVSHRKKEAESQIGTAEEQARKIMNDALKTAETKKKEALIEAKDEIHKLRSEANEDIKERRSEVTRQERRLQQKEESIDKKTENLEAKDEKLSHKVKEAEEKLAEAEVIKKTQLEALERISSLTIDQAKTQILSTLENELVHEKAMLVSNYEQQAKNDAEQKARELISFAISRLSAEQVSEATVSVVPLPSDDMKGRIIGREGRNIRTLETITGVDLIIDDTPEAITLSCFDPVRREIARQTLEKLISDGRIHPSRIEETVDKARRDVEQKIRQAGEQAVLDTNVLGLHNELIKLLGRLRYRTSYGQNVLDHSIEVSFLSGMLAAEIGVDETLAKRAGLLHDIGKSLNHEIEGSHVEIGVDICRKYKENADVLHAIESHHGDVEPKTIIACIVQAADAISAARPAARRENLENYIKRLEKLEGIANSFEGIEKSFAIQAGREIRIIVKPDQIKDDKMVLMAREIVQKIENELDYPGQIKVHMIRESRAIEFAK